MKISQLISLVPEEVLRGVIAQIMESGTPSESLTATQIEAIARVGNASLGVISSVVVDDRALSTQHLLCLQQAVSDALENISMPALLMEQGA